MTYLEIIYNHHKEAKSLLHSLILRGKITLSEISLQLRFDRNVYLAAIRSTRGTHKAEDTIKTIMNDVIYVLENQSANSVLSKELPCVLEVLYMEIETMRAGYFTSKRHEKAFCKHTLTPFVEKINTYKKERSLGVEGTFGIYEKP